MGDADMCKKHFQTVILFKKKILKIPVFSSKNKENEAKIRSVDCNMELFFFFHNPVRQLPKVICDSCCINSHLTSVRNTRDSLEICGHDQRLSQEGRPFLIGLSRSVRALSRLTGLQLVEKHFLLFVRLVPFGLLCLEETWPGC